MFYKERKLILLKNVLFCVFFIALSSIKWLSHAYANEALAQDPLIEIILSPIPPLVMEENGKSTGILVDLSKVLIQRLKEQNILNIKDSPTVLPWSRAYKNITTKTNKIMLQMARSKERESLFNWTVPTGELSFAFVSKDAPAINTLEEARSLNRIAVYRASRLESFLKDNDFTRQLAPTNNSETGARLLNAGRVNAWYASIQEAKWLYKSRILAHKPVIGRAISLVHIWAVTSKGIDKNIVSRLTNILVKVKNDGTLHAIRAKYGL